MKKFTAVLLSVLLVMGLSLAAFATAVDTDSVYDAANGGFSITIDNAVKGETYNAYKIFDVVYANDADPAPDAGDLPDAPAADDRSFHENYAYTIDSVNNPWFAAVTAPMSSGYAAASTTDGVISVNGLTFTPTQADAAIYAVEVDPNAAVAFDATAFAKYLKESLGTITADGTVAPSGQVAYHEDTTLVDANDPDDEHHDTDANFSNNVTSVTISGLDAGYYFVTTTLGNICSLDTTEPEAVIREKNDVPFICKEVSDAEDGNWSKRTDIDIGDNAWFRITVVDGQATNLPITVHDTLDPELTLNADSFTVQLSTKAAGATDYTTADLADTHYTLTTTGLTDSCTFEIVIDAETVAAMNDGDYVTIIYSAQLNEDAKIYQDEWQENDAWLTYANQTSVVHTVEVYTYQFDVIKTDKDDNVLEGAEFELALAGSEDTPLAFVLDNGVYRPAVDASETTTTTLVTGADGYIHVKGLDAGTYTLTETKAPTGYNMVKDPVTVRINGLTTVAKDANEFPCGDQYPDQETRRLDIITVTEGGTSTDTDRTGNIYQGDGYDNPWTADLSANTALTAAQQTLENTVEVENNTGSELPSTGGIGTYIFYIVGAILVIGAGIILVAKRRAAAVAE